MLIICGALFAASACKKGETTNVTSSSTDSATVTTAAPADTAAVKDSAKTATPAAAQSQDDAATAAKFVEGGTMEVKLGNLAQTNASNQKVKDFGKMMVQDHTKAGDELKALAKKKGWTFSEDLGADKKAKYDEMAAKKGADFDKAYSSFMVDDHKEDIADYKKAAAEGKDSDFKAFAQKTLPTLEHHLKMAEEANAAVK